MKKAQGLPITVIIIAALALIVLFVLIGIFAARTQKFGKGVGEATEAQVCKDICLATACEEPLVGNFVDINNERLKFNEVCCAPGECPEKGQRLRYV